MSRFGRAELKYLFGNGQKFRSCIIALAKKRGVDLIRVSHSARNKTTHQRYEWRKRYQCNSTCSISCRRPLVSLYTGNDTVPMHIMCIHHVEKNPTFIHLLRWDDIKAQGTQYLECEWVIRSKGPIYSTKATVNRKADRLDYFFPCHARNSQLTLLAVRWKRRKQTSCSTWSIAEAPKEEINYTIDINRPKVDPPISPWSVRELQHNGMSVVQ
jgi:hypothetical protein